MHKLFRSFYMALAVVVLFIFTAGLSFEAFYGLFYLIGKYGWPVYAGLWFAALWFVVYCVLESIYIG